MPATRFSCSVVSKRNLTPTVFEICFRSELPIEFKAGQFVSVVVPGAGPGGRDLRRAYSVASPPQKTPIELCVKLVEAGPGTHFLYRLSEGERFDCFAPYGDFVYRTPPSKDVFFISTGTGIAPFRSMVLSQEYKSSLPRSATCLFGVRSEDEVLYSEEFSQMPGMKWVPTVSQPGAAWTGFRGRVTDYLRQIPLEHAWTEAEYYLCGNGAMIDEVKKLLAERGVGKESIHQEIYYRPKPGEAGA